MTASNSARRRMTVAEFLAWNSGDDRHYELVDGRPVAMAPPSRAHRLIAGQLLRHLGNRVSGRGPCSVEPEAGIRPAGSHDTYLEADLAVSCAPYEAGQQETPDPVLIVEILSPSTDRHDRMVKVPKYRGIPSVREIVLVAQDRAYAEVHRRLEQDRWLVDLVIGLEATLHLDSIDLDLPLAEVYRGVALES